MLMKTILAVLIIVVVVVGGIFFKDYFEKSSAADTLRTQIKNNNNTALTVSKSNQALQAEIDGINANAAKTLQDIDLARQVIKPKTNLNEIVLNVLTLGSQQQVTVIPISTQPWTSIKVGQHNYQVFKMTIEVDGAQDRLVSFVKELQKLEHQPLVIESLSLNKPSPTPTPTPTPSPTPTPVSTTIVVETNDASAITTTMATLNGNLTSLGTDYGVNVSFQYGLTSDYTGVTSVTKEQWMTKTGTFKAAIGDLTPGLTYHFRAKAAGASTIYGQDVFFKALLAPAPTPIPENTYINLTLSIYAQ